MSLFLLVTALGAFLLFQVQPLMGRFILPWFGGSPAVWSTCMLFFQALLLGGYAYAHALSSRLSPRRQAVLHGALVALVMLLVAGVTLASGSALHPGAWLKPLDSSVPVPRILLLLTLTVAAPYFILSATSPLVQTWFSMVFPGVSPYRLYVLSNAGSLAGLLTYPFLVEPAMSLDTQALVWCIGFVLFAVAMIGCALRASPNSSTKPRTDSVIESAAPSPALWQRVMWLALAACASTMLLATTNRICQDVAVAPLLWVLPLAVYLVSFIITFAGPRGYSRLLWGILLALSSTAAVLARFYRVGVMSDLVIFSTTLLSVCMVCHGELVRMRPHPMHLTSFYLMVSGGGAAGGAFVTLLAPLLFDSYWEYPAALVGTWLLLLLVLRCERRTGKGAMQLRMASAAVALAALTIVGTLGIEGAQWDEGVVLKVRSFYGVSTVFRKEFAGTGITANVLLHGTIKHGMQFLHPELRRRTTTYYGPDAGVGRAIRSLRSRSGERRTLNIGVIGLGAGTLAAQARQGDSIRFYEIDHVVIGLSSGENPIFTFVRDSAARGEFVLGDGRVSLERELADSGSNRFDILVVDAFSGDAPPIHLLTVEALRLFLDHLAGDGILAVNATNRYVDIACVVAQAAAALGRPGVVIRSAADNVGHEDCTWILLADRADILAAPLIAAAALPLTSQNPGCYWTDDHFDLFAALWWAR